MRLIFIHVSNENIIITFKHTDHNSESKINGDKVTQNRRCVCLTLHLFRVCLSVRPTCCFPLLLHLPDLLCQYSLYCLSLCTACLSISSPPISCSSIRLELKYLRKSSPPEIEPWNALCCSSAHAHTHAESYTP